MSDYSPDILELARRVKKLLILESFGEANYYAACLANLILASQEKPKEARKVGAWVVVDNQGGFASFDGLGNNLTEAAAKDHATYWTESEPKNAPFWPCYVTGTEGIGPQDTPPTEEKQEKARGSLYNERENTSHTSHTWDNTDFRQRF